MDWLFHHDVEVIVNTDVTPDGAKLPPVSREHPVYYLAISMGYRDLGACIAGDKQPSKETMYDFFGKALAKQGYLPANAIHPPTEVVVFAWGSLYVESSSWDVDFPVRINERGMLRFLGGEKLGLISKFPGGLDTDFGPDLQYLRPDADKFRSASQDDLYMAVVLGYDFAAAAKKHRLLLWRTRIACPSRGLVMADTLPTMISIAAPLIARETAVPSWIRASDKYEPVIRIGEPVVEGYLGPGPLSSADESKFKQGEQKNSKK